VEGITMKALILVAFYGALSINAFAQDSNPSSIGAKHCVLGNEVIVPNVLGSSPEKAKAIADECGLKWLFSEHPQTISYEPIGTIGIQQPNGGTIAKRGDTLRGFVSKGVFLPSFIGWDAVTAEAFVHDLRLGFSKSTRRDGAPAGTVVEQAPIPGVFFNSTLTASVVVSEGPWVEIPDLKNKSYDLSVVELTRLKLVPVHGGGDLESGSKQITNCELIIWYPVVEEVFPFPRAFEGDSIVLKTKRRTDVQFSGPPGIDGKICQ